MKNFLDAYSYELPDELIARTPAEPRDSARLLVYQIATNTIIDTTFAELHNYIPEASLLVMNETRVVPARVLLTKQTGGKVEVLFLMNELGSKVGNNFMIRGMVDRKVLPGDTLAFGDGFSIKTVEQNEHIFTFAVDCSYEDFEKRLIQFGTTPVPRYIGETGFTEQQLRDKYQTVFASSASDAARSVAAPTASLHFTEKVFENLAVKNIQRATLQLHVGQGTFAPVTDEQIKNQRLHEERIYIPVSTQHSVSEHLQKDTPVIAVGTTAARALESLPELSNKEYEGATQLFIQPGYHFRYVQGLITNFHLPKTSLMSLVDAFLKDRGAQKSILDLYQHAISKGYRFYSFGDAMLCI